VTDRLSQLLKLLERDPADPFLCYGVALEHRKAGRPRDAVEWLDRALACDPLYCYAYFQKAKSLMDLGDDEAARQALTLGLTQARKAGDSKAQGEITELLASLG
jgi:tetratricopeptide (TPR) repeat protein